MLRVPSECSASVRKSLQGLNYFAADCAQALDTLIGVEQANLTGRLKPLTFLKQQRCTLREITRFLYVE